MASNYLMAWSANDAQIYQLDLRADRPEPTLLGVGDAGMEKFLYPQEVEAFFRDQVEAPAWGVLGSLRKGLPVRRVELEPLLSYLVSQMVRTPRMRDHLKTLSTPLAETMIETYREQGVDLSVEGFGVDELVEMHRAEIRHAYAYQSEPGLQLLQSLDWEIWRLGPVGEFVTSDNPITTVLDRPDGSTSKLAFPLSPKLLLVGGIPKSVAPNGTRVESQFGNAAMASKQVSEIIAHSVNRNLWAGAHRFLYGRSPAALMAALRPMNR